MGEAVKRIRKQLVQALKEHELDSAKLKVLREQVQTEIELHELLSSLGRNELLLDFVDQLEEDFSRAASIMNDGLSDDERRRMQIPPGVSFEIGPDAESLADLRMLVRYKTWLVEITWHGQHGLMVRPLEGHRIATLVPPSLETSDLEHSLRPPEKEI